MADTRLRAPDRERDPLENWPHKTATKTELENLRAKVNLLEFGGITADKLGGGTISTQSIQLAESASLYSGSPDDDGFILDVDGLRFYDGGVNTINLTANGGTATFTGTITASTITGGTFQTSATGMGVVISSSVVNMVQFYTGHGSETHPGGIVGAQAGDLLEVTSYSPRAGHDYSRSFLFGRSSGTPEAQAGFQVFNSAGVQKGALVLGSKNSISGGGGSAGSYLDAQGLLDVTLRVDQGIFWFARPVATNGLQLRWQSIPIPGFSQVGLGVDHGAAPNRLNVQAFDGVTPLNISASGFDVVSKREGKENIKERAKDGVLTKVKNLKPVDYTRPGHKLEKTGEDDPGSAPDRHYIGFLAEDLMIQFPEAVVRDKEGNPDSIDLMAVVAILTQAVQELAKDK